MATKKEGDVFDELESTTRPRDVAWGTWQKFEKVDDSIQGFVRDAFYRPADGLFKEQRGITIEKKDGTLVNVGIKRLPFVLSQTDDVRIGDPLRITLSELKPSSTKGYNATKIFTFQTKALPENAGNKTVGEMDRDDQARGGSVPPPTEAKPSDDIDPNDVPFD